MSEVNPAQPEQSRKAAEPAESLPPAEPTESLPAAAPVEPLPPAGGTTSETAQASAAGARPAAATVASAAGPENPPSRRLTSEELPARHEAPAAEVPATEDPVIIGFLCEWAADLNGVLDANGVVQGLPNVRVIKIPCSGMTKPAWLEMALKQGADGVFVCGCPIVDCHFREGNVFIRDRMLGRRTPKPKRLDLARARGYWYEATETEKLVDDLHDFTEDLRALRAAAK